MIPAKTRRVVTLDVDAIPEAISTSVCAVLMQRGLLEAVEAQDPVRFATLLREIGNNAAMAAICCADVDMLDAQEEVSA